MTKKHFFTFCTCINGMFIGTQIYKHTQFVHYMYQKQQKEHQIQQCKDSICMVQQQWYALQDRQLIKEFAHNHLGMRAIALHQIKRLDI